MTARFAAYGIAFVAFSASAFAQPVVDLALPSDFAKRIYINPADLGGIRDRMDRVVGYWGVLTNGQIQVSTDRPASFSGAPVTQVKLGDSKPIYRSVLSNSASVSAAIPVFSMTWSANQKAEISVMETAQFVSTKMPTQADWATITSGVPNSERIVFIDSAVVNLVETSVLTKNGGTGSGIFKILTLGGDKYVSNDSSSSTLVVSVTGRRPIGAMLAPTPAPAPNPAARPFTGNVGLKLNDAPLSSIK